MDDLGKSEVARWVAPAFILCSVVLIPWIVYLGFSLPTRQVSSHYDVAWVGFDVLELIALGATGYFALRRSRYLALASASAATLLVCDAWFDVLTSPRHQILGAVVLAAVIELPLAGVCAWLSFHTERLAERRVSVVPQRMDRFISRRLTTVTVRDLERCPLAGSTRSTRPFGMIDLELVSGASIRLHDGSARGQPAFPTTWSRLGGIAGKESVSLR
jgi:hypothetical protein